MRNLMKILNIADGIIFLQNVFVLRKIMGRVSLQACCDTLPM